MNKKKIIIGICIGIMAILMVLPFFTSPTEDASNNNIVSENSDKNGISNEQEETIRKLWNKVSNYGTMGLKRVALNSIPSGYELYLEYSDTSRNGKYVVVTSLGTKVHYGDETNGLTSTYKESMDNVFKLFETDTEDIVLTLREFKSIIND